MSTERNKEQLFLVHFVFKSLPDDTILHIIKFSEFACETIIPFQKERFVFKSMG